MTETDSIEHGGVRVDRTGRWQFLDGREHLVVWNGPAGTVTIDGEVIAMPWRSPARVAGRVEE